MDFGNFHLATVSGRVFAPDTDSPLSGWTVFADVNGNGMLDADKQFAFRQQRPLCHHRAGSRLVSNSRGSPDRLRADTARHPDYAYAVTVTSSGQTSPDRDFANLPDTTAPDAQAGLSITPNTGTSATDGVTNTGVVTFAGTLSETDLLVHLYEDTTYLGDATISGTTFHADLNLGAGLHHLRAVAENFAQNSTAASLTCWLTSPRRPVVSRPCPPPRSRPASS